MTIKKKRSNLTKVAYTPMEISEMYGISVGSLANLRHRKQGPRFFKVGGSVYYKIEDFEGWFFQNPVQTLDSIRR